MSLIFAAVLVAPLVSSPAGGQTNYPMQVVTPNYVEADTALPLPINGGDDGYWEVPLPFDFTFHNVKYLQGHLIYVSTNGYINFLAPNSESFNACPISPPIIAPNGAIYAFWDDLIVNGSASVGTRLLGTMPNRQFVIEWRSVTFFDSPLPPPDFEIVLHETGTIVLQYRNIGPDGVQRGNSATIGLENQTGELASQFSCNTASLGADEFAIQFGQATPPPNGNPPVDVIVDIKPMRCPNWFNVNRRGEVAVAILGTADFDVKDIDPSTVTLGGVAPVPGSWRLKHVGAHVLFVRNSDTSQCTARRGRNRHLSAVFKINRRSLGDVLASANHGDEKSLKLSGKLRDGTEISGEDSVLVINKAKQKKKNTSYHHSRHGGYWLDKDRNDDDDNDRDNDDD
jgi:hypothetical protein